MLSGLHSWSWKSGQISLMAFASSWIHHQELPRQVSLTHNDIHTVRCFLHLPFQYSYWHSRNSFKWHAIPRNTIKTYSPCSLYWRKIRYEIYENIQYANSIEFMNFNIFNVRTYKFNNFLVALSIRGCVSGLYMCVK